MKDTRKHLIPHLKAEIAAAQERAAAPFTPEALREALSAAARLGFAECRIEPLLPVPVQQTAIAADGMAYLRTLKVNFVWEPGAPAPKGPANPGGSREEYHILVATLV